MLCIPKGDHLPATSLQTLLKWHLEEIQATGVCFFLRSNLLIHIYIKVVKCASMYAIQLLIQTIVESAGSQHQATELLR